MLRNRFTLFSILKMKSYQGPECGARRRFFISLIALSALLATPVLSQNFTIESSAVNGGGGTSQRGRYAVQGTIGQPGVETSSGGRYRVDAGFWGGVQVVQVVGFPRLRMAMAGESIVISWEDAEDRFTLQESGTFKPADWSITERAIQSDGITRRVTLSAVTGRRFFRLLRK
jgi:hypothetical protein